MGCLGLNQDALWDAQSYEKRWCCYCKKAILVIFRVCFAENVNVNE